MTDVMDLTKFIDSMSVERDIRFDLIARLCPNTTGAELRSVATEVSHLLISSVIPSVWFVGWNVRHKSTPQGCN